jgi:small subunit ribosomal protein S7
MDGVDLSASFCHDPFNFNHTTLEMPPQLKIIGLVRAIPFRPKPQVQWLRPVVQMSQPQIRSYSDSKDPPAADRSKREDSKPLPHVSEEAATMAKITGSEGPDLDRGTPVEEVGRARHFMQKRMLIVLQVVKGDKSAQEKLPKVMKDAIKKQSNAAPKGSRSYSTTTTSIADSGGLDLGLVNLDAVSTPPQIPGLKFELPVLPIPKDAHVKHRYDPVVDQVTNLLMRHGKKSVAQRVRYGFHISDGSPS